MAAAAAVAAVAIRRALDPYLVGVQFITFFPAVILVAYAAGPRAGLLTGALCGVAALYWYIPPFGSLRIERLIDVVPLGLYLAISSVLAGSVGSLRTAVGRERQLRGDLQEERDRARQVLNSITEGVLQVDRDFRIVQVNAEGLRVDGRPAAELLGRSAWEAWPGIEESEFGRLSKTAMAARTPLNLEHVQQDSRGRLIWFDVRVYPTGEGLAVFYRDITARKQEEEARAASEAEARRAFALLEAIGASSPSLIYAKDRQARIIYANAATLAVFGKTSDEVLGRTTAEIAGGSDEGEAHADNDLRVMEAGGVEAMDEVYTTLDGVTRTFRSTKAPLRAADGTIIGVVGVSTDVTSQLEVENALRESQERLDLAVRAHGIGIFDWWVKTGRLVWSEEEERLFGLEPGSFEGDISGWSKRLLPQDAALMTDRMQAAMERREEHLDLGFRIRRADGEIRYIEGASRFLYDDDGATERMVGTNVDVTERRRAEEHQRLLINELNHRVKNTLAVVQGIAFQTFKGDAASPAARRAFEGRLTALSAAHNVLTRESWSSASIGEIIADAVAPFRPRPACFELEGPDLRLAPKTAVSLALAIHELGTNASKYGALTAPEGRVSVRWSADDGRLHLIWRESGGPEVRAPATRGFGTRMIERGLAAELDGSVKIAFEPDGLVCAVDAPLPRVED